MLVADIAKKLGERSSRRADRFSPPQRLLSRRKHWLRWHRMKASGRRHLARHERDWGDTEIGDRRTFVSRDRKHAGQLSNDAQPAIRFATCSAIIDSTRVANALATRDAGASATAVVRVQQRTSGRWQDCQCKQQAGSSMAA
jgi:hypothetical protein